MKLILVILFLLFASQAEATQTWVALSGGSTAAAAPGGCASASGASDPGTYYRTIRAAAACYGTSAGGGAGHTIIIKNGTYTENLDEASVAGDWLPKGSSWSAPFTLKAENRLGVTIRRDGWLMRFCAQETPGQSFYTIIDGFVFDHSATTQLDAGLSLSCSAAGANYLRMQFNEFKEGRGFTNLLMMGTHQVVPDGNYIEILNNTFHDGTNTGWYAVYIQGGYHGKFIGNTFYNLPSFILHFNEQDRGHTDDWEIAQNYFHHWGTCNGGAGGTTDHAPAIGFFTSGAGTSFGSRIHDNLFNCGSVPVRLDTGGHHVVINNTVYGMSGDPSANWGTGGTMLILPDTIAKNNIIHNSAQNSTNQSYFNGYNNDVNITNFTNITNNVCTNAVAGCAYNEPPATTFTTPGSNFTLKAGSAAINNGADISALSPYPCTPGSTCRDYAGLARPQGGVWDIGAFEFGVVTPPTPQLVLALPLDEGTGTTASDVSGQKNNATLVGGATWDNAGKYGKAVALDGTGYLNIPYTPSLGLSQAMTLEAWVYPTVTADQFFTVIYQGNYWLFNSSSSGSCPTPLAPTGGYAGASVSVVCATSVPSLNTWSHLALTYDGLNLTVYLNGNIVASQSSSVQMIAGSNNLTIGRSTNDSEFFIGKIDEPRVYNYARPRGQIVSDMNTPLISGPGNYVEIAAPTSVEISSASSIEIGAD